MDEVERIRKVLAPKGIRAHVKCASAQEAQAISDLLTPYERARTRFSWPGVDARAQTHGS